MDYQELKPRKDETGILNREGIYFHSPSDFARKNLYYIHFGGLYTCTFPYRVNFIKIPHITANILFF